MEAPRRVELQTVLVRSRELVHSDVDGEVTMMNVETGKYYGLTDVGARIWALLEEPIPVERICDRLMSEYQVDRQKCEGEVLSFIQRMCAEGVVMAAPSLTVD